MKPLSIRIEIDSYLISYGIVDRKLFGNLNQLEFIEKLFTNGKESRHEFQRRILMVNAFKFYIKQRSAEYIREKPVRLKCVEELL
jgi:hypothetical protein